jgi:type IV pilus modification protein PilV
MRRNIVGNFFYLRQSGVTLLEVMITVVILSLGLLGLAGLQMTGLKNNREAFNSTLAAQVLQDLSERIRSESSGEYDEIMVDSDTECSKDVGAAFEARVKCQLALLPEAEARVTLIPDTQPKAYYVAVIWSDPLLNNTYGWGAGVTGDDEPDESACGDREAAGQNKRCFYTVLLP